MIVPRINTVGFRSLALAIDNCFFLSLNPRPTPPPRVVLYPSGKFMHQRSSTSFLHTLPPDFTLLQSRTSSKQGLSIKANNLRSSLLTNTSYVSFHPFFIQKAHISLMKRYNTVLRIIHLHQELCDGEIDKPTMNVVSLVGGTRRYL